MKPLNLSGQRFGSLTVIKRAGSDKKGQSMWLCRCDCGNEKIIRGHDLKGGTKSCGCSRRYNTGLYKHGLSKTRLHRIWRSIKDRCYNDNSLDFKFYGGRGVSVCAEWKCDFLSFFNWASSSGYKDGLTIDRIDVNGDYCPENCRWVPIVEQANNKRNNTYLTYHGETKTISQWARELKISPQTISSRLRYGFSMEKVLDNSGKRLKR